MISLNVLQRVAFEEAARQRDGQGLVPQALAFLPTSAMFSRNTTLSATAIFDKSPDFCAAI